MITGRVDGGSAGYLSSENALYFGGDKSPAAGDETEEWNGSAWSELNDLITARLAGTGVGTTEAALMVGGDTAGNTEEWNGTNWAEVTAGALGGPSG